MTEIQEKATEKGISEEQQNKTTSYETLKKFDNGHIHAEVAETHSDQINIALDMLRTGIFKLAKEIADGDVEAFHVNLNATTLQVIGYLATMIIEEQKQSMVDLIEHLKKQESAKEQ